jgi:DNA replication protein DnaC
MKQQSSCPICEGAQALWDHEQSKMIPCECQREAIAAKRLRKLAAASSMTPRLQRQTFSGFEKAIDTPALRATAEWALGQQATGNMPIPAWLFLTGKVGTGKTHLLASATNALMARGESALYVVAPDLFDYIRAGIGQHSFTGISSDDALARLALIRDVEYLLIDEIGKEHLTDYAESLLFSLLDYRYRWERKTAIASNLGALELPDYLASRLGDRAVCRIVQMANVADYRLLPPEERTR